MNTPGYSTIRVIVIIAVIAVVAIIGLKLYNNYQEQRANDPAAVIDVPASPAINKADDLNQADTTLNEVELETTTNSDLTELDKELSEF